MRWDPTVVADWTAAPLDHRVENMTTARLERRCGTADGQPTSVVVKTLQPASAHPAFAGIPEEFHAQVLADLDWRGEPHLYRSGLADVLPPPLRMPAVHAIVEDGEDRCSIWMEDVRDVEPWDLPRYRRTAEALGALGGRWEAAEAEVAFGLSDRDIGRLFFGKVLNHDLPAQAEDAFWADPVIADLVDHEHRRDLLHLADAVPRLLAATADGPRGVCHGDASPANFLEPGDGSIVAVDWSYGHVGRLGSDLAQLLAGRIEAGRPVPAEPGVLADEILDAYLEGLRHAGRDVDPAAVRRGLALHLAVRSAFSLLLLDHLGDVDDDERGRLLAPRARLGRYAIDLALSVA